MPPLPAELKSNLPFHRQDRSVHWWTREEKAPADAWSACLAHPACLSEDHVLKRAKRRLVLSCGEVVVKAFPFAGVDRWRRSTYALDECAHLLEAERRGLPVPRCLGYGEARFWGGLRWNAAAMERLSGATLRDEWLGKAELSIAATLEAITPLAYQLYLSGSNHIDFGPHAIVVTPQGPRVIDWQYATFLPEPNPAVFASQIGYFAWATSTNRSWATASEMSTWFEALWESYQIPHKASCRMIFDQTRERRHSISERLAASETFRIDSGAD